MKFWPGPYLGDLTQPRDALYAHAGTPAGMGLQPFFTPEPWMQTCSDDGTVCCMHAGMADMAEALLQDLRPYLIEAKAVHQDVTFGAITASPLVC